jgi:hypothetical protein
MPPRSNDPQTGDAASRDAVVQHKLTELKKAYDQLHTQKITTEANIKNLENTLEKLRATAVENYGTSDLQELQRLLEERRRENEAQVAAYEEHVREITTRLAAIEEPEAESN